ncbi:MAG: hypothetical protein Q7R70_07100, partial [Candidatus Diapherotrites archaeon]|nr:hypothetical protein [Candidatus Diapherotrites archaeon]
ANLILISILIPLLIYFLAEKWWAVLAYFSLTSLPHILIYGATYPQAMILFFFLIYLMNRRNFILLTVLSFAAAGTHKSGAYLFAAIFILELAIAFGILIKDQIKKGIEENLKKKGYLATGLLTPIRINNSTNAWLFFLTSLPIPLVWFGLKKIVKEYFFLGMVILSMIASWAIDWRASSIAQILFIIAGGHAISETNKKTKIAFIVLACILTIYYFLDLGLATVKMIVLN